MERTLSGMRQFLDKIRVKVQCQECGKRFTTGSLCPTCPKCGGSDVDLA
jgi:Zn finger protein HypA/HybF involved in hydrogenase expression